MVGVRFPLDSKEENGKQTIETLQWAVSRSATDYANRLRNLRIAAPSKAPILGVPENAD